MQKRIFTVLSSAALLVAMAPRVHAKSGEGTDKGKVVAPAADSGKPTADSGKIVTYVNARGTLVFTNMVANAPAPVAPVIQEKQDRLAEQMPPQLRALVDTISENHGVDPALVRAVMKTESNFDRWAVSHKGA